ncbi:MAG: hypothetical protein HQM09_05335 [Candidatus Riflebacteria bacterium]|nr:hypothetical protein [Candidatus Riflebacteria bacterium]
MNFLPSELTDVIDKGTSSIDGVGQISDERGSKRPLLIAALIWCGGFGLAWAFGAWLPDLGRNVSLFLTAGILVTITAGLMVGFSRLYLHRTAYLVIGALAFVPLMTVAKPLANRAAVINHLSGAPGGTIFLSLAQTGIPGTAGTWAMHARNRLYTDTSDFLGSIWPESSFRILMLALAQLTLALGIGLWIGNGIDEISHLIPIALVATFADAWSVSAGATAMIVQSSQIHYFLLRFPLLAGGTAEMPFLIGLSDFLFLALFHRAAVRFHLGELRNLIFLSSSFFVATAGAIFLQKGLPVLPFMAGIFVAANWGKLQVKRDEIKQIALFFMAIVIMAFITTLIFHPE